MTIIYDLPLPYGICRYVLLNSVELHVASDAIAFLSHGVCSFVLTNLVGIASSQHHVAPFQFLLSLSSVCSSSHPSLSIQSTTSPLLHHDSFLPPHTPSLFSQKGQHLENHLHLVIHRRWATKIRLYASTWCRLETCTVCRRCTARVERSFVFSQYSRIETKPSFQHAT